MDNYPDHLAPEFDEGGGVSTPFDEWWLRVKESFPTVPEEVAKEWLHRHWHHSPWEWLPSAQYRFDRVLWPAEALLEIRCRLNNFKADHTQFIAQGDYLANEHRKKWGGLWLTEFMLREGVFPSPPILIDNRDGHLVDHQYGDPGYYPHAFLLVEGHKRFELGRYLLTEGRMKPQLEFYLMSHIAGAIAQP
ncbi:MAG: hypothetical protein EWV70_09525 [Microcystis flos-aquae Mf_QC_C_20070823_S20]|nr:MAG: hypothetical protein EWV70_09525 [Microcystis flos-aquae Mf_QC_C_20070823_S20]